ncbi:MAG: tetratricopeptide repeat protein [Tissierellia bacterium]|nr:tetratricopeptide repeat protein [Tissierellia bacterium]
MLYEKLIKERLDDIAFMELKEGKTIEIGENLFTGYLPLPIMEKDLVGEIVDGKEDFNLELILKAAIFLGGLDKDYEYNDIYLNMLYSLHDDPKSFIMYEAMQLLKEKNIKDAIIYFNYLINMDLDDETVLFSLGNALELYDISNLGDEDKNQFVIDMMHIYEKAISKKEDFSLPYYKLGYIYALFGQYVKAKLTWEKFLKYDKNDFRRQEINEQIDYHMPNYLSEAALTYMHYGDYVRALEFFNAKEKTQLGDGDYYNMSICYLELKQLDKARDCIKKALKLNECKEYLNQLALIYKEAKKLNEAIEILERAIDKYGSDYYLNYNLGVIQLELGDRESAMINFEIANDINPTDKLNQILHPEMEKYFED